MDGHVLHCHFSQRLGQVTKMTSWNLSIVYAPSRSIIYLSTLYGTFYNLRQYLIIDASGQTAFFTGLECI
jgi:hypothetical protein